MGDHAYFIGIEVNQDIILMAILAFSSQLIYWNNYKTGVQPTLLRLFKMMSETEAVITLGLTNKKKILGLISQTTLISRQIAINSILNPILKTLLEPFKMNLYAQCKIKRKIFKS